MLKFVRSTIFTQQKRSIHKLPDLPYDYNALEPVISAEIMKLHHSKHHQAYVNNLNVALEKLDEAQQKNNVSAAIALQPALTFNGGGHVNHSIFWTNLCPPKQYDDPKGALMAAITKEFGSLEDFKQKFNAQTAAVQGSGWGWLGYNKQHNRLEIATTANQDPLLLKGLTPLLGVDVWEHAYDIPKFGLYIFTFSYYLQYKNARPDYLKEIWKIINWQNVSERFVKAQQQ